MSMSMADLKFKLKQALGKLRTRKKTNTSIDSSESQESALPVAQIEQIEKHHFVFGLDWRFYTDRKDLTQTLNAAKKDSYTHKVVTQTEDLVGIGRIEEDKKKNRLYSGSLQLAQGISLGGVEIFVFQLQEDNFCLVALNESRPVVGFEKSGTRSEILALAGEFQLAHVGHNIRQVGNSGSLEHEEHIKLAEAFSKPDENIRIKKIPDYRILFIGIFILMGVGFVAFLIYGYFNEAKLKEAAKRLAQERDPNFIYEKGIAGALQGLGLPAQVQLERWRNTINNIPMSRHGWSLTEIKCLSEECKISWVRQQGSYTDFFSVTQAHEIISIENQQGSSPASSAIQTLLKVPPTSDGKLGLLRESLPSLSSSQRSLGSQLQDLSLLENSQVTLSPIKLFGAPEAVTLPQLNKPVVHGEWQFVHELWSLGEVSFKLPALVLDELTIYKPEKSDKWNYSLTGKYYAKGKDF
jgi:hypothetical protein